MTPRRLLRPASLLLVVLVGVSAGARALAQGQTVISFDKTRTGSMPPGFRLLQSSGDTEAGRWRVERIAGIATLSQVGQSGNGYQLAVLESPRLRNLQAGVRLRRGPDGDGAAGLAWRVRDGRNYYAARLDLEARYFALYKFVRGNRVAMKQVSDLRLDEKAWHELAISHDGERLTVWLNGVTVATERDRALPGEGMLGVWMPSDSTAHFTHLWYAPIQG